MFPRVGGPSLIANSGGHAHFDDIDIVRERPQSVVDVLGVDKGVISVAATLVGGTLPTFQPERNGLTYDKIAPTPSIMPIPSIHFGTRLCGPHYLYASLYAPPLEVPKYDMSQRLPIGPYDMTGSIPLFFNLGYAGSLTRGAHRVVVAAGATGALVFLKMNMALSADTGLTGAPLRPENTALVAANGLLGGVTPQVGASYQYTSTDGYKVTLAVNFTAPLYLSGSLTLSPANEDGQLAEHPLFNNANIVNGTVTSKMMEPGGLTVDMMYDRKLPRDVELAVSVTGRIEGIGQESVRVEDIAAQIEGVPGKAGGLPLARQIDVPRSQQLSLGIAGGVQLRAPLPHRLTIVSTLSLGYRSVLTPPEGMSIFLPTPKQASGAAGLRLSIPVRRTVLDVGVHAALLHTPNVRAEYGNQSAINPLPDRPEWKSPYGVNSGQYLYPTVGYQAGLSTTLHY